MSNCDGLYNHTIRETDQKDLGVTISPDLRTPRNCESPAAKDFRVLYGIRRSFRHLNVKMFRVLYTIFVRPHLKYEIQAQNPYFKC